MELSVILTIHNKGWLASTVVDAIIKNTSTPFELIVVYDGCTDNSRNAVESVIKTYKKRRGENKIQSYFDLVTPDIHETKANNAGLKSCKGKYGILVQDDMVVNETGWDTRLIRPMLMWDDVFAVSARNAFTHLPGIANLQVIGRIEDDTPRGHYDITDRNLFRIRDGVNRGPLCFDMEKIKQINYLDEEFAPSDCDDVDISWRAYLNRGWRCGVYPIDYLSDLNWGTTRIKSGTYSLGIRNEQTQSYQNTYSNYVHRNWVKIHERYGRHFGSIQGEDRVVD